MAASPIERPDDTGDSLLSRAFAEDYPSRDQIREGLSRGDRFNGLVATVDAGNGRPVHSPEESHHREGRLLPGLRVVKPSQSLATAHDEESLVLGCRGDCKANAAQGYSEVQAEAEDEEIAYKSSFAEIAAAILLMIVLGAITIGWLYWVGVE